MDGQKVTQFDAGEALILGDATIDTFSYRGHQTRKTRHGDGVIVTIHGESSDHVRKTVELTTYRRLSGMT